MHRRVAVGVTVVAAVAALLVWQYSRQRAADEAGAQARIADMQPVIAAVDASAKNSAQCTERFAELTDATTSPDATRAATLMDEVQTCGFLARALADEGYTLLDISARPEDSEAKSEFLDAAGATLSVYELQGDEFDALYDLASSARADGAPLTGLAEEAGRLLHMSDTDISDATAQFERAQHRYATTAD